MQIELLTKENFSPDALAAFDRSQHVRRIYRKEGGAYRVVPCEFTMDWDAEKKREVAEGLLGEDCVAYIARDGDKIAGFAGLYKTPVEGYLVVDLLQVDARQRRRGLGRRLFETLAAYARAAGCKGLYISAFPGEDTIRFYLAMNCRIAENPIAKLAEEEPDDVQMICPF